MTDKCSWTELHVGSTDGKLNLKYVEVGSVQVNWGHLCLKLTYGDWAIYIF